MLPITMPAMAPPGSSADVEVVAITGGGVIGAMFKVNDDGFALMVIPLKFSLKLPLVMKAVMSGRMVLRTLMTTTMLPAYTVTMRKKTSGRLRLMDSELITEERNEATLDGVMTLL